MLSWLAGEGGALYRYCLIRMGKCEVASSKSLLEQVRHLHLLLLTSAPRRLHTPGLVRHHYHLHGTHR
jgi:hypothetical protein